jgi:SNF2 family DNA or RNA helicase
MPDLRPFQVDAVRFMEAGERTIYGDPPGTGKTAPSLVYAAGRPGRTLIVTPANVLGHWREEAELWTPDLPFHTYRGSDGAKARKPAVEGWLDQGGVLVTNYEAARRDYDWLGKAKPATLILDEAHRIKNRKTVTAKAVAWLARRAHSLAHVTGTPVMNRAEELWSMLNMIAPRVYTSYWRWAEEHFYVQSTTFGGKTEVPVKLVGRMRPGAEERIMRELMGTLLIRPLAVLLPELGDEPVVTKLPVKLSPAERKAYDHLLEYGWLNTEDGDYLSADLAIARLTRLKQLMAGWSMLLPDRGLGTKQRAAVELAEDLAEPVLIFTMHQEVARRIAEELTTKDVRAAVYTGNLSADDREQARIDFVRGDARYLVGTIAALGVGVDGLQHSSRHVIFVDQDPVYDINRQAIGRLWRMGQTGAVNVWVIAAEDTVDDDLAASLVAQADMKERLTGKRWQELTGGPA